MQDLKDTELRVLLVLLRQTVGWNRDGRTVVISYKTLKRVTGRESQAIAAAIRSLAARGLIHIIRADAQRQGAEAKFPLVKTKQQHIQKES